MPKLPMFRAAAVHVLEKARAGAIREEDVTAAVLLTREEFAPFQKAPLTPAGKPLHKLTVRFFLRGGHVLEVTEREDLFHRTFPELAAILAPGAAPPAAELPEGPGPLLLHRRPGGAA
ncbi:MAG: hypothetical protein L6R43_18565 [Planctomycetes bacterium]|nr:hypothetical protein [Planctomycetota bacterium]